MARDGTRDGQGGEPLDVDECIRAGMYWFGHSDLEAARAWWEKALELEPDNVRAMQCLRLAEEASKNPFSPPSRMPSPSQDIHFHMDAPEEVERSKPHVDPSTMKDAAESFDLAPGFLMPSWLSPATSSTGAVGPPSSSSPSPAFDSGSVDESLVEDVIIEAADVLESASMLEPEDVIEAPIFDSPVFESPMFEPPMFEPPIFEPPTSEPSRDEASMQEAQPLPFRQVLGPPWIEDPLLSKAAFEIPSSGEDLPPLSFVNLGQGAPEPDLVSAQDHDWGGLHADEPSAPLQFAVEGDGEGGLSVSWNCGSPWDEGPARTSAVTLDEPDNFDALAEPTPLPGIHRSELFGKGSAGDTSDIIHFEPILPGQTPLSAEISDDPLDFLLPSEGAPPTIPDTARAPQDAELLRRARDRFALHDFAGALELLEEIPSDSGVFDEARRLLADARSQLLRMYESKIGSLDQVPEVLLSREEIIWLNLNHRAGFILSQIDGAVTYEDLLALSGMSRLDTMRILSELIQQRVIGGQSHARRSRP